MFSLNIPKIILNQNNTLPIASKAEESPQSQIDEVAAKTFGSYSSYSSHWTPSARNRSLNATINLTSNEQNQGLEEAKEIDPVKGFEGIEENLDKIEPVWFNYKTEKFCSSILAFLEKSASQQDLPGITPDKEVNTKIFATFDRIWETGRMPNLDLEATVKVIFLLGYACKHEYPLKRLTLIANFLKKWLSEIDLQKEKLDHTSMCSLILGLTRLRMCSNKDKLSEVRVLEKLLLPFIKK